MARSHAGSVSSRPGSVKGGIGRDSKASISFSLLRNPSLAVAPGTTQVYNPERQSLQDWAATQSKRRWRDAPDGDTSLSSQGLDHAVQERERQEAMSKHRPVFVSCYPSGKRFLTVHGTSGSAFYTSGDLALTYSSEASGCDVCLYNKDGMLLAAVGPAKGSVFWATGQLRAQWTPESGTLWCKDGSPLQSWAWGASLGIVLALNDQLTVRIAGRLEVVASFRGTEGNGGGGPCLRINMAAATAGRAVALPANLKRYHKRHADRTLDELQARTGSLLALLRGVPLDPTDTVVRLSSGTSNTVKSQSDHDEDAARSVSTAMGKRAHKSLAMGKGGCGAGDKATGPRLGHLTGGDNHCNIRNDRRRPATAGSTRRSRFGSGQLSAAVTTAPSPSPVLSNTSPHISPVSTSRPHYRRTQSARISRRTTDARPKSSNTPFVCPAWNPPTEGSTSCQCSQRTLAEVADSLLDAFLQSVPPAQLVVVLAVPSPSVAARGATTFGQRLLGRLYAADNQTRKYPCLQSRHDPWRFIQHTVHRGSPLVKRHHAHVGQLLVFRQGQLVAVLLEADLERHDRSKIEAYFFKQMHACQTASPLPSGFRF